MRNNIFIFIRVLLGLIFIVSGFEKAVGPYQNFLYVIQGYDVFPSGTDRLAAMVFPWVELLLGVFVLVGLWLVWAFRGLLLMSFSLILIVAQAIIRKLPLENCGCFGDLVHLPLQGIILLDVTIFVCAYLCLKNLTKAKRFSVDEFCAKNT